MDAFDGTRAELKRAPLFMRGELAARLSIEEAEMVRVGKLSMDLQSRLKTTRAAIKRAEADSRPGRLARKG